MTQAKAYTPVNEFIEQHFGLELDRLPAPLSQLILSSADEELTQVIENLKSEGLCWLVDGSNQFYILNTFDFIIWQAVPVLNKVIDPDEASDLLKHENSLTLSGWSLADQNELIDFVRWSQNPLRTNRRNYRMFSIRDWVVNYGKIDLDDSEPVLASSGSGFCLGVNRIYKNNPHGFVENALKNEWKLVSVDKNPEIGAKVRKIYTNYGDMTSHVISGIMSADSFKNETNCVDAQELKSLIQNLRSLLDGLICKLLDGRDALRDLDSATSPLPKLTENQFQDPNKGIWELWGQPESLIKALHVRSRNPALDIKDFPVAIDFGTSSTVVAYKEQGKKRLLRIGVKDFLSPVQQIHFENPTVLELVDLPAALQPWQASAYRPRLRWGDLRCSHEALSSLRDNEGDSGVNASILTKLKHWALRENQDVRLKICDQLHKTEMELPPLTLRNPIKGQPLKVDATDPLDPIEVYAYFLGLSINWRQRGLFLEYYMTFPVTYPQNVKDKILASFRRGLQRSLPEPLIHLTEFDAFRVEERGSEPAAFAATALPHFEIEPTLEGVAYAVFDFGGGTTDFDFGIYREPTPEEEDQGCEEVLEHFGASGDKFLGGENLLERLAYEVFKANLDLCREKRIAFTCPPDAEAFPGSEILLEKTQAAFTNTQMLMSRLRPYWEERQHNEQGIEKVRLLNREGEEVNSELTLPYEHLENFLKERLTSGVQSFFIALHKAFNEAGLQPEQIHVFLAGNASQSPQVQQLFGLSQITTDADDSETTDQADQIMKKWVPYLFGDQPPEFRVYPPISENPDDPYQATAKTGVALGLLELCPGSPVSIVNRSAVNSNGEAPFDFYVGNVHRRRFKPALKRHVPYHQWREVGPVREGTFVLVSSQSPAANTGEMREDDPALEHRRLHLSQAEGQRVFIKAVGPNQIELCTAISRESLEQGESDNQQILML